MTDLSELRELLAKATQGEWMVKTVHDPIYGPCPWIVQGPEGDEGGSIIECGLVEKPEGNAALIVAAVNALPALLDELDRLRTSSARAEAIEEAARPFQDRVQPWMLACFGPEIAADRVERCDRFIEEAFELVQSMGWSAERAKALIDYTWSRPAGEPKQEVGGVMVTLAALCLACDLDMHHAGEAELARIWTKVKQIRAKQAAKPTGSALPIRALSPAPSPAMDVERVR